MALRLLMLLWLIMLPGAALAHLLPKQNATMNIIDNSAYFVVSVPISALRNVDDDGNGLLSLAELQAHSGQIQAQFTQRFHVSESGNPGQAVLSWVVPPQTDGETAYSDYVVVLHRVNFASSPQNPSVHTDLFGSKPGESQMTLNATRNNKTESEVAILDASAPSHRFFRGGLAIFADFLRIGIEHILGGLDHLLFLLTIIIAGAGWRYWLGVVTSFTVAHSITLALAALGVLRVPAQIIEPGIAASIVIMALLNLRRTATLGPRTRWSRIALVFACGLLHGFGFASAIGAMSVDGGSRIATLAGFNLGIEIGQLLFVAAVLLLAALLKRTGMRRMGRNMPRYACLAAAVLGSGLLIQRLGMF